MSQDLQDDLTPSEGAEGIAVVGMAGRFPGAADLDEFWRNLRAGVESVTVWSREELAAVGVDPALLADPRYAPAAGARTPSPVDSHERVGGGVRRCPVALA